MPKSVKFRRCASGWKPDKTGWPGYIPGHSAWVALYTLLNGRPAFFGAEWGELGVRR